jgi:branched-chain amino acid aminotransferase
MNRSDARLCIPQVDEQLYLDAIKQLVRTDIDWVPTKPGTSLYIRPFMIATDPHLGVKPSDNYLFIIILSPVGANYPEGLNPVKILVENEDVRSVKGGTGMAKPEETTRQQYAPNTARTKRVILRCSGWTVSIAGILKRSAQ